MGAVEKDIRNILLSIQNLTQQVLLFGKNLLAMQAQLDFLSTQNARHDEQIATLLKRMDPPSSGGANRFLDALTWAMDLTENLKLWHLIGSLIAFGAWGFWRHHP